MESDHDLQKVSPTSKYKWAQPPTFIWRSDCYLGGKLPRPFYPLKFDEISFSKISDFSIQKLYLVF